MAAAALILNVRSLSAAAGARKGARSDVASAWVEQAIAGGLDPIMRQQPLNAEDPGEWRLVARKVEANDPGRPEPLPEEHFDEAFMVLARLGRLRPDGELRPWHGAVLPDDSSARALALRVRLAREALSIDPDAFYLACGVNPRAGQALEAGNVAFASFDSPMLPEICARHTIPEDWIMFGTAEEIEA
jgi:hypothetical protein